MKRITYYLIPAICVMVLLFACGPGNKVDDTSNDVGAKTNDKLLTEQSNDPCKKCTWGLVPWDKQIVDTSFAGHSKCDSSKKEDFNKFLTRFQTDTAFHISRIKFPLPLKTFSVDQYWIENDWVYALFGQKGLKYPNSLPDSQFVYMTRATDSTFEIHGFYPHSDVSQYIAFKIKDCNWYMICNAQHGLTEPPKFARLRKKK